MYFNYLCFQSFKCLLHFISLNNYDSTVLSFTWDLYTNMITELPP